MSPLTATAEGIVGQLLFAALAMLGGRGAIKAGLPMVDNEGRDVEVHLGGRFKAAFAVQVKVSAVLQRRGRLRLLRMTFVLPLANQVDHPCFWYLFAYLDENQARLAEWVFLVPSRLVHAHCSGRDKDGQPLLSFQASMEADAHDQWTSYRMKPEDLGKRLVELMQEAPQEVADSEALAAIVRLPGLCLLGTE